MNPTRMCASIALSSRAGVAFLVVLLGCSDGTYRTGKEGSSCLSDKHCTAPLKCLSLTCSQVPAADIVQETASGPDATGEDSAPPVDAPKEQLQPAECPDDMVEVTGQGFCIDRYENSRQDATESDKGAADGPPQAADNKIPWFNVTWDEAKGACESAGKRLCTPAEWQAACQGPEGHAYPYGDVYSPQACVTGDNQAMPPAGMSFPLPTGYLDTCEGGYPGLHDMSGNVAEWVDGSAPCEDRTCMFIKGGKYNTWAEENSCAAQDQKWNTVAGVSLSFRCCMSL